MSKAATQSGWLGKIERAGNKLPDPVFLFLYFILALVVISVIADLAGLAARHPTEIDEATGAAREIGALSLLSAENIRRLWTEMPTTFTHFHPLGYVLVVMLGAGVAERSGLFGTAMRAGLRNAPKAMLTPLVVFVAMMGNHAADAGYVVLIPLAGIIFHAAGRHPIAGIAAGFAGVSGGFSANVIPGQLDALLFGLTQAAVETVFTGVTVNIAGNWYFITAMTVFFLPVIWYVTDRIIEPRLGEWQPQRADAALADDQEGRPLTEGESKGLRWAGLALLAICALWAFFVWGPGTPLVDQDAPPEGRLSPFYNSLVAFFFLFFLAAGWAYGKASGAIRDHRDLVKMMSGAMADMSYYLVLAFVAAHFVAMFNWSNLGLIFAVKGADLLGSSGLPAWALLAAIIVASAFINLFVGSASAKWALLGPVLVPMLMLLGITPEMATAAYRVGDSATNIITPLMPYFPLILVFAQRWDREFGLGSLAATMLPYSIGLMIAGLLLTVGWVALDLPLGPGAEVFAAPPAAQAR
ncbi:MAG: AbgT family transporter [Sphingomonadaceae bacterium]